MKNIYYGKRCFILATGPSLTISDIEALEGEITFSMNSMYLCYGSTNWRPTHYFIGDPDVLPQLYSDTNLTGISTNEIFFSHILRKRVSNCANFVFVPTCWLNHWHNHNSKIMCFTPNLLWGCYDAFTSTTNVIQIAAYMGISEIYLLGADCNYDNNQKHFISHPSYDKDIPSTAATPMFKGYAYIKECMDNLGVKVYNASRSTKLEVFPKVCFDDIILKEAR